MANYKTKGFETPEGDTYDIIPPEPEENIRGGISASYIDDTDVDSTLEVVFNRSSQRAYVSKQLSTKLSKIEDRLNGLEYVAIKIVSAALSVATAEKGSTVSNLNLSWTLNKVPTIVTVDAVQQALGTSGVAILSPVSANETYSLVVGDGKNTDSKNLSIVFCNRVCYGVSTSTTYNSALINSLANKILSTTKARTISVNAGAGQYVYYCIPSSLGTPSFSVGGFEGGFHKMATINHTNASGFSENYDIYRSDNATLGSVSIVIT